MNAELEQAIAEIKRELDVETAQAHIIAERLPDHLRQPFWQHAIERYLATELDRPGIGDADEPSWVPAPQIVTLPAGEYL